MFIIGNPRSGTTLLRLMITCHPAIVVAPECGFAVWLHDRWGDWDGSQGDGELRRFVAEVEACRKFDTWDLDSALLLASLRRRQPRSYRELAAGVYWAYSESRGRRPRRWGDKNNFHVHHVEALNAIFPDCRFVHIVRDGRDVACSYLALAQRSFDTPYAPSLPTEPAAIAGDWRKNVFAARAGFAAVGWERVHEVRFDDLVLRAETTLREICRFLDEPYRDEMLDYPTRAADLEPPALMGWKRKTLEPPRTEEVGRFRRELSADQLATFEGVAGDLLRLYGFPSA